MEILEKMFGGSGRVKIMRLFLFNPTKVYDKEEITIRAQVTPQLASREISQLSKTGLIKKKGYQKEIWAKKKIGTETKVTVTRKKVSGWQLNSSFLYLEPLEKLLINLATLNRDYLVKRIQSTGKMKLIVFSGIFIQDPNSRVDIFIVGDKLRRNALTALMKQIEAEIGKEIRYAAFDTEDFQYRMGIYDKLVRDVFDYPHHKVLDKLGIPERA